jgi:hypothetical protein
MYELWDSDDPMPSCEPCMNGEHDECLDLLFSEKYGMYACGCTNEYHNE